MADNTAVAGSTINKKAKLETKFSEAEIEKIVNEEKNSLLYELRGQMASKKSAFDKTFVSRNVASQTINQCNNALAKEKDIGAEYSDEDLSTLLLVHTRELDPTGMSNAFMKAILSSTQRYLLNVENVIGKFKPVSRKLVREPFRRIFRHLVQELRTNAQIKYNLGCFIEKSYAVFSDLMLNEIAKLERGTYDKATFSATISRYSGLMTVLNTSSEEHYSLLSKLGNEFGIALDSVEKSAAASGNYFPSIKENFSQSPRMSLFSGVIPNFQMSKAQHSVPPLELIEPVIACATANNLCDIFESDQFTVGFEKEIKEMMLESAPKLPLDIESTNEDHVPAREMQAVTLSRLIEGLAIANRRRMGGELTGTETKKEIMQSRQNKATELKDEIMQVIRQNSTPDSRTHIKGSYLDTRAGDPPAHSGKSSKHSSHHKASPRHSSHHKATAHQVGANQVPQKNRYQHSQNSPAQQKEQAIQNAEGVQYKFHPSNKVSITDQIKRAGGSSLSKSKESRIVPKRSSTPKYNYAKKSHNATGSDRYKAPNLVFAL